jgi:hypothetical protein
MDQHVYFGIENLNLNDTQRGELIQALRALGPASHPQPCCLCHWRTRLDGQAAIFEALFDEDTISIDAFKQWLGVIFGISWVTIGHSITPQTFDTLPTAIVTFSRTGVDYIRVAFFGYDGTTWPSWMQSGDECRAYLALYRDLWEESTE